MVSRKGGKVRIIKVRGRKERGGKGGKNSVGKKRRCLEEREEGRKGSPKLGREGKEAEGDGGSCRQEAPQLR